MAEIPANRTRRRTFLAMGLAFALGLLAAARFFRKEVKSLVALAKPYVRRSATVKKPVLIINPLSGDGKAKEVGLVQAAERAGIRTVVMEKGDHLTTLAENAIKAGADALGMAGGDGSLGVVAQVAIDHDVPFFCIPVGTRNHFALDLGLDRDDPLTALDALPAGDEILVDYAVAGDKLILNNVSFGVYAQAVHQDGYREKKDETMAKVLAEAATNVENQAPLRYTTPDGQHHDRAPLLIISNNPYRFAGPPDYGRRVRLDSGKLGIGAITRVDDADAETTTLQRTRDLQQWEAESYTIESDEPILAGLDGEAMEFTSPLVLSIKPKGLRVLVPKGTRPGYVPPSDALAARLLDLAQLGGAPE